MIRRHERPPFYREPEESTDLPVFAEVRGYRGITCKILGLEVERYYPEEEDPETGEIYQSEEIEERDTGKLVARMVGDDHRFTIDPDDIIRPIQDEEFCRECGQIGCRHGASESALCSAGGAR